jgi:hypothetical protein
MCNPRSQVRRRADLRAPVQHLPAESHLQAVTRRPSATNGGSTLRGDEEGACARKLDDSHFNKKILQLRMSRNLTASEDGACVLRKSFREK